MPSKCGRKNIAYLKQTERNKEGFAEALDLLGEKTNANALPLSLLFSCLVLSILTLFALLFFLPLVIAQ